MRLLTKSEVAANKAVERKVEIDEGAKLARKVDALRETVSVESQNLAKFRLESLKKVKEEIILLLGQKTTLEREIKDLALEKTRLQKPLDDEWKFVHEKEEQLQKVSDNLLKKQAELNKAEEKIVERDAKSLIRDKNSQNESDRIQEEFNKAAQMSNKAQDLQNEVAIVLENAQNHAKNVENQLILRETSVVIRERDVKNKEDALNRKTVELANQEKAINDKYQTLLRTQQYVSRKRK